VFKHSLLCVCRAADRACGPEADGSSTGGGANESDCSLSIVSALCCLRGRVYELQENRSRSIGWFRAALVCDAFCHEAFDALVDNQV
jgi:hypothetical protein